MRRVAAASEAASASPKAATTTRPCERRIRVGSNGARTAGASCSAVQASPRAEWGQVENATASIAPRGERGDADTPGATEERRQHGEGTGDGERPPGDGLLQHRPGDEHRRDRRDGRDRVADPDPATQLPAP